MGEDPLAIEVRHGGGRAIHASERPHVVDIEEQPPVARAPELVELHQARLDVGPIRVGDEPQCVGARGRVFDLVRGFLLLPLDVGDLFDFDLPLELELAQLDEQLAFLRHQRFGLALERADAFRGPLRRGPLCLARGVVSRQEAGGEYQEDDRRHADGGRRLYWNRLLPSTSPGI